MTFSIKFLLTISPSIRLSLKRNHSIKSKVILCVRGVVSPLLSNVYLHEVMDCWYEQEVKPRMKGKTFLARFADDLVLGFENKEDAEKVYRVLFKHFEKYGLSLHPEKTRLVPARAEIKVGESERCKNGCSSVIFLRRFS